MLPVYICEDKTFFLKEYEKIINDIITEYYQNEIEIICVTYSPNEVLERLRVRKERSIYFLDIDLGPDTINGIQLATEIRKIDPLGHIVIVTTYNNMITEVFKNKLNVVDFVVKDDPEFRERINENLKHIIEQEKEIRKLNIQTITFKYGDDILVKRMENIYAIEVIKGGHQIIIHEKDYDNVVTGSLNEIQKELRGNFHFCSKSVIINLNHLKTIKFNSVIMNNGLVFPTTANKNREIKKVL